ncbi:MAG: YezD family protein [Lachnospiraceae bacterium]|nr:YezD family protein [Ruminococcus sp.]MCM1275780.1 YezD family protein [Lachnospiraceae bacterium]
MPNPVEPKKSSYLEMIDRLIRETKYGSVTVIIQDGKVIQIEKTDKIRLQN